MDFSPYAAVVIVIVALALVAIVAIAYDRRAHGRAGHDGVSIDVGAGEQSDSDQNRSAHMAEVLDERPGRTRGD